MSNKENPKYTFGEKLNDWKLFEYGKTKIVVTNEGVIDHLTTPQGKTKIGVAAREYVLSREKLYAEFQNWHACRAHAIAHWLVNQPHFHFECDGGALAVRIDGGAILRVGCGGDGGHRVYVADNGVPDFFSFTGTSIDNCTIEPLDYDYEGGKPLCEHKVKAALFYRFGGNVAIAITKA